MLSPSAQQAKQSAIHRYESQLSDRPGGAIVPARVLEYFVRPYEMFVLRPAEPLVETDLALQPTRGLLRRYAVGIAIHHVVGFTHDIDRNRAHERRQRAS
jgi:hypothetical protein